MIREVSVLSPEWDELLRNFRYDFYHLSGYVRLNLAAGDQALAVYYEDNGNQLFFPLVLSRYESGACGASWDALSAYGYSSPLSVLRGDEAVQYRFLDSSFRDLIERLRGRIVSSMFVRLHPVLPLPMPIPFMKERGTLVPHGRTVSVDLSKSEEEIWNATDANDRRRVSKLKKLGCSVVIDESWSALAEFHRAYVSTMERLDASKFYFFPIEYFRELRGMAPGCFHLVLVKAPDARIMWAGIFSEFNRIVQFHLSGTTPEFEKMSPTKMALDYVRRWAKQRGNEVVHLGGGYGAKEDSLFDSKRRMATDFHQFYSWRVIVDPVLFARLTEEHANSFPPSETSDFFPPYRRR